MGCFQSRVKNSTTSINTPDDDIETVEQIQYYKEVDSFAIMQEDSFQYPSKYNIDMEANYADLQVKILALEEVYYNMVGELKVAKTALKVYDKKMKLLERRFKADMIVKGIKIKKHSYNLRDRNPKKVEK